MKALRTFKLATAAIALVAVALPARAGLLSFTKTDALIGAAVGVGMVAITTYKDRCKSGGGWFDDLGKFQAAGASTGHGLVLTCPTMPGDWTTTKYAGAALELHGEVAIFKSTAKLRKNMKAAGKGEKPDGCDAHHIVPEKGGSSGTEIPSEADLSRDMLKRCGIDIDDAANGVFLPGRKNPEESKCKGAYHKKLHTALYIGYVLNELLKGYTEGQCKGVRSALNDLSEQLRSSGRDFNPIRGPNTIEPQMPNFN